MSKKYALLRPDEDGNCFRMLDEKELKELLENAEEYWGITHFVTEEEYKKESNLHYWKEGWGMLMEIEIIIPKPVKIVEKYSIDRGDD